MLITDLSFPVLLENNQFIVGGLALNRQLQTQMDYYTLYWPMVYTQVEKHDPR
jgi:hypothetical protein